MHFEILIEDISGKNALDILIPKIVSNEHTFNIHSYKGIGRIPQGLKSSSDPKKRILLDRLPNDRQNPEEFDFQFKPSELAIALIILAVEPIIQ